MSELVVLGRLGRPHGIRGEIRADYYAESPLLLEKPLLLRAGRAAPRPARVTSWRYWQGRLVLKLDGVDDRSAAELLRGQELLIKGEQLPEPDEDEAYLHDMLGLPVFARETGGETGGEFRPLGVLEHVLFPAGQEVWSIRAYRDGEYDPDLPGQAAGHEILFPAVPEFVDDIDLDAGRVLITPPAGLLDLYAPAPEAITGSADGAGGDASERTHTRAKRKRKAQGSSAPSAKAAPPRSGGPEENAH